MIGDGIKIANDGQVRISLQTMTGEFTDDISSTVQVAKVSMSVGEICDNDVDLLFNQTKAKVLTRAGHKICTFVREHGGLYIAKFRLWRPGTPTPFVRHR